jgi:hypothetical protein
MLGLKHPGESFMRFVSFAFLFPLLITTPAGFALQAAPSAQTTPAAGVPLPSAILQPPADALGQAVGAVKLEKWKNGSIRSETAPYLESIQKDLQSTLPSLLKDADAAPNSMSLLLPVLRNVDALYDVALRVVDGASVAAPAEQVKPLQDALAGLDKGRRGIQDRLMTLAADQEKHVSDLQLAIKNQPPPPVCPVVAPAETAKPATKKKAVKKKPATPAAQPAPKQPATAQPSGTAKPNQ